MCGIIGFCGMEGSSESAAARVLEGIKRLEYRGYDSAGLVGQSGFEQPYEKADAVRQLIGGLMRYLSTPNAERSAQNAERGHMVPVGGATCAA